MEEGITAALLVCCLTDAADCRADLSLPVSSVMLKRTTFGMRERGVGGEGRGGARIYKPRVHGLANRQWAFPCFAFPPRFKAFVVYYSSPWNETSGMRCTRMSFFPQLPQSLQG